MLRQSIILLAFLAATLHLASAAIVTVTLSGTCTHTIVNQSENYVIFNLSNTGNGDASDFVLYPQIAGTNAVLNSSSALPTVVHDRKYSTQIYFYNLSTPGTYAAPMFASYSQPGGSFSTVFICLISIDNSTQSQLTAQLRQSGGDLNVEVLSNASYPADAKVEVIAPPEFNVSNPNASLQLAPHSSKNLSFGIAASNIANASFPIYAVVSYSYQGMHYASVGSTLATFRPLAPTSSSIGIIMAGVIAVLAALIVLSLVRRRSRITKIGDKDN